MKPFLNKQGTALFAILTLCCSAYAQPWAPTLSSDVASTGEVRVCCRPLPKWSGAKNWLLVGLNRMVVTRLHHCYIEMSGDVTSQGATVYGQTSSIHPIRSSNDDKQPMPDQLTDSLTLGGECKNVDDATPEKINSLREEIATGTCPSCGGDYHNRVLSAYYNNCNTYVFELISHAGMTPPKMKGVPGYRRCRSCARDRKELRDNL